MNASDTSDDFFEDGLYYLKKSIQLLAEDSNAQHAELSMHGLLEEMYDEMLSCECLFRSGRFSNSTRSAFAVVKDDLRKICDAISERKAGNLELKDFETMEWQELRSLSKDLFLSLDMPAKLSE